MVIDRALVWISKQDVQPMLDVTYLEGVGKRAEGKEALTLLVFCLLPQARACARTSSSRASTRPHLGTCCEPRNGRPAKRIGFVHGKLNSPCTNAVTQLEFAESEAAILTPAVFTSRFLTYEDILAP
jgi:hypothetical protein